MSPVLQGLGATHRTQPAHGEQNPCRGCSALTWGSSAKLLRTTLGKSETPRRSRDLVERGATESENPGKRAREPLRSSSVVPSSEREEEQQTSSPCQPGNRGQSSPGWAARAARPRNPAPSRPGEGQQQPPAARQGQHLRRGSDCSRHGEFGIWRIKQGPGQQEHSSVCLQRVWVTFRDSCRDKGSTDAAMGGKHSGTSPKTLPACPAFASPREFHQHEKPLGSPEEFGAQM